MQRRWLEMQDFWTLAPNSLEPDKKHLFECKDNKSQTGHSLLVRLAATHSANVNGNKRFYLPNKMQEAVHTWTNKPVPVPVLREHNKQGTVFGRVRSAKYIDETHKYDQEYPILRDTAFYNTDSTRIPMFDSVDWVAENLVGQDNYAGLGYIELGTQITNADAIKSVLNDEFLTVSVGFKTDAAICSICHTDWASEDKCSHKLGSKVNGKDTFLITGNLDYNEVSFVNFAADPFATKLSVTEFTDSLNKKFYLGLSPVQQHNALDTAGLTMSDSLITFDDDITVFYEDSMEPNNLTLDSLDTFIPEIKSKELTAVKAFEFKNVIDSLTPETPEQKAAVRSIKSTLNSRIKREKWSQETDSEVDAEMQNAFEDKKEETAEVIAPAKVNAWDGFTFANEDEKAFFEDSDGLTQEIKLEFADYSDAVTDEASFCGPNKSFAVTDSASALACRSVVSKAPISEETKDKIEACIDARETTLGLNAIPGLDGVQAFTDAKTGVPEKVIGCYGDLHANFIGADVKQRRGMRQLHSAIGEVWSAHSYKEEAEKSLINSGHNVNAYGDALDLVEKFYTDATEDEVKGQIVTRTQGLLTKFTPNIVLVDSTNFTPVAKTELADSEETINELTTDLANEKIKSAKFFKEAKTALATQIVLSRVMSGSDGFKDLSSIELETKITDLSKRNFVSLRDSVKDILVGQKFVPTSVTDSQETQNRVDEKAQVSETETVPMNDSVNTEEAPEAYVISSVFKYLSPIDQARYFAEKRFSK